VSFIIKTTKPKFISKMRIVLIFVISLLICISSVASTCQEYVAVDPSDYTTEFVDIQDSTKNNMRPLGYTKASYIFEGKQPCFTIKDIGGNGRHVEVRMELSQMGTLMIKNDVNGEVLRHSGGRQFHACGVVPATSPVTYTFFCTGNGCETGEKTFWFRFVVEKANSDGQFNENWCEKRSSRYPSSLMQISPLQTAPPENTTPPNRSSRTVPVHSGIFLICLLATSLTLL